VSKKKPSRTALRRRSRAERPPRAPEQRNAYSDETLRELESAGEPLSAQELAERLNIRPRERKEFDAGIAALERAGEVVQNRAGALLVAKRISLVAGRVEGHPDGHGFLVPDEGGPSVFLPPAEMRGLMHKDRAAVRVSGRDHRGRPVGALVEVLERGNRRVVGRLHSEHGVLVLVPEDRRIAHDILVPPAEAGKAKPGQIVTVELISQPAAHAQPVGRVAEVLGHHTDPGMEIEIALRKFDLPHEFSKRAMGQAKVLPNEVTQEDSQSRKDLRDLPLVTIDGETAKDFDDAVEVQILPNGNYRLGVHIADVAHYVTEGSALDREAFERGTSVYFPGRAVPMLPERLSNGICSLNPRVDRLTFSAEIEIDRKGRFVDRKVYKSVIRTKERMTYTKVNAILTGDDAGLSDEAESFDDAAVSEV